MQRKGADQELLQGQKILNMIKGAKRGQKNKRPDVAKKERTIIKTIMDSYGHDFNTFEPELKDGNLNDCLGT